MVAEDEGTGYGEDEHHWWLSHGGHQSTQHCLFPSAHHLCCIVHCILPLKELGNIVRVSDQWPHCNCPFSSPGQGLVGQLYSAVNLWEQLLGHHEKNRSNFHCAYNIYFLVRPTKDAVFFLSLSSTDVVQLPLRAPAQSVWVRPVLYIRWFLSGWCAGEAILWGRRGCCAPPQTGDVHHCQRGECLLGRTLGMAYWSRITPCSPAVSAQIL